MDQALLDSIKVKHIAGEADKATEEELANWYKFLEAEGVDKAAEFLGKAKAKTKKAKK